MTEINYECCRDCRLLDACNPNYNGEPPCFQKDMESQNRNKILLDMSRIPPMARDKIIDVIDSEISRLHRNLSADIHESQVKTGEMIGWQKGLWELLISIKNQDWGYKNAKSKTSKR